MNVPSAISMDSVVVAASEQVTTDLSGETVILQIKTSNYYGLNAAGTAIWEMIQSPLRVDEIRNRMLEKYDVPPEQCEKDLLAILSELAACGLVRVSDEPRA